MLVRACLRRPCRPVDVNILGYYRVAQPVVGFDSGDGLAVARRLRPRFGRYGRAQVKRKLGIQRPRQDVSKGSNLNPCRPFLGATGVTSIVVTVLAVGKLAGDAC